MYESASKNAVEIIQLKEIILTPILESVHTINFYNVHGTYIVLDKLPVHLKYLHECKLTFNFCIM